MRLDVQALHYMQSCTGLALYAGLYRPCTIHSAVQALNYTLCWESPALNAVL